MILSDIIPTVTTTKTKKINCYREVERAYASGRTTGMSGEMVAIATAHPGAKLPRSLSHLRTPGAIIAQTPQTALASVRRIADLMGFLLVPFEYVHPSAYNRENTAMQDTIRRFNTCVGRWYHPYVLCPLGLYSVDAHASAGVDLPVYSGPTTAQAMAALSGAVLALKQARQAIHNIINENQELKKSTSLSAKLLAERDAEIRRCNERIAALEKAKNDVREDGRSSLPSAKKEVRVQEVYGEYGFRRLPDNVTYACGVEDKYMCSGDDPLLIGIPSGHTVYSDCNALVGPCWGPEIDDAIFAAAGLEKVRGQRERLAKSAEIFGLQSPPPSTVRAARQEYWFIQ